MSRQTVDRETHALLNRVRAVVQELEPTAQVIVYGSRAREEAAPDSDWDILVLVDGPVDSHCEDALLHRLFDLAIRADVVISAIVYSKEDWANGICRATPWHENVTREGIAL